jgi:CMP/dCMP kinase
VAQYGSSAGPLPHPLPHRIVSAFEVIALDGPGGVGKSTTARALAQRLGYFFLSSGQIYRALAWSALAHGWQRGASLAAGLLDAVRIEVAADGSLRVDGQAPGAALSSDAISQAASVLSTLPEVRALSNRVQRDTVAALARAGHFAGVILEGRDIGTVVFPDARHKFFITASTAVRAQRRFKEERARDPSATLEAVQRSLEERDRRDSEREHAPLRVAPGATVVDTGELTLEQVLERLVQAVQGRSGSAGG